MANISESATYEAGIYQLETTDPVLGGPSGIANTQAKQLANRTKWLKEKVDLLGYGTTGVTAYTGNLNSLFTPGWYYVTTAGTNKPSGATQGFLQVARYNSLDYTIQIFYSMDGDRCWTRNILDGPAYGDWSELGRAAAIDSINTELVGLVAAFAYNTQPANWLKCNGAAVSRTSYAALFAKIGTTFGAGNGSTTFNLPDLRGEFIRGWDDGRNIDSGRTFGTWQDEAFKSHQHLNQSVSLPTGRVDSLTPGGGIFVGGGSSVNTNATGGSETRPRNVALLYCIKYK